MSSSKKITAAYHQVSYYLGNRGLKLTKGRIIAEFQELHIPSANIYGNPRKC